MTLIFLLLIVLHFLFWIFVMMEMLDVKNYRIAFNNLVLNFMFLDIFIQNVCIVETTKNKAIYKF